MTRPPFAIFCPVSSLPSRFGIGDFGPTAEAFIDWLAETGASAWQVLPLTVPDSVGSPYASPSNSAGSWLYISPEFLVRDGWLDAKRIPRRTPSAERVRYTATARRKLGLLREAFSTFERSATPAERRSFRAWQHKAGPWLQRFVEYQALKDKYGGQPWWKWSATDRRAAGHVPMTPRLQHRMQFHAFMQWVFDRQWQQLKARAHQRGITIIGDLPFYVPLDSVAVWAQPQLFELDRHGQPTVVAGVPPDGFSDDGQRWGNPVYRWSTHRQTRFRWWHERLSRARELYDLVRLDHFRGLVATWHIPRRARDPKLGRWVATPGRALLSSLRRRTGTLPVIAEDLGKVTPDVTALRQHFNIPGVRVVQYGWSGLPNNLHHAATVGSDAVYYTSTHDTNTTVGWWRDEAHPHERQRVREELGPVRRIHEAFIQLALRSSAALVVIPIQDVFGLGSATRINVPGTKRRNWAWRLPVSYLTAASARQLRRLVERTTTR